uniref:Uncharacterized protein n=1 Tax=Ditylenchus dipsaci TaxID=166011 RepID=A0A915EUH8_9BILA
MPKIEFIYAIDSPRYRLCCCAARVSALVFAFLIAFYSFMHLIGSSLYAASESIPGLFIIFFFVSPMLGLIGSVLAIVGFFTKLSLLFILGGIANALYLLLAAVAITFFIVAGINYQVNVTGECPLLPPWFHTLVRAWYKFTKILWAV